MGDDVDIEIIKDYVKSVSEKLSLIGIKTAVFGSDPSRTIPSGYSKEKVFWQIEQTLCIVNEESLNLGIEIVIEPLTPSETNMFNTVRETYDFCKKINLKNVHLLADLYHVGQERDLRRSMSDIAECGDELKHVHIACPIARTVPMKCDGFDYSMFFSALKNANYRGNISVEAWPQTREALRDCKEIFDKYTAP